MRVVLAGATGFLGSALVRWLRNDGHILTILTRRPRQPDEVRWDPYGAPEPWLHLLEDADAVINLAGAPISERWTAAHKREIRNSRIQSTRTLVAAIKKVPRRPGTLINASAVGIYGDRGDRLLTERDQPDAGFLASVCREWEQEALQVTPQTRVVLLRSGIALDSGGGALPLMALPFRFFVGGPIASGRQFISWIHRDDWVAMVSWVLTNNIMVGPLNVTSPNPVTNAEFSEMIGRVLRRPSLVPVPALALRIAVGELADELIGGQRVLPEKAQDSGFTFRYPQLEGALREIYGRA